MNTQQSIAQLVERLREKIQGRQNDEDEDSDPSEYDGEDVAVGERDGDNNENNDQNIEQQNPAAVEVQEKWIMKHVFRTEDEVNEFLKRENWWSSRSSVQQSNGFKRLYRCNLVRSKTRQCDAEMYTLYTTVMGVNGEEAEMVYQIYVKNAAHTHDSDELKPYTKLRVTEPIKEMIKKWYDDQFSPSRIRFKLRDDENIPQMNQPTIRQIKNVIANYKIEKFGAQPLTMADLTKIMQELSVVPDDEHKGFVVKFERSPPDQKERYFLLRNAQNATVIHADATYKVTTEKLPLIVVGCSDSAGKFHLGGIMVSSHENGDAFACAFQGFREGIEKFANKRIDPEYLVADADAAIHNGFHTVFDKDNRVIMCYAHVMRNVNKKYTFAKKDNKKELLNDLRSLHKSGTEDTFSQGCELFVDKWKTAEAEVTKKIDGSWFRKNNTWYIGSAERVPKTNNLLERFNGLIKQQQTFHLKQPLKMFINTTLKIVSQRSREYVMDKNVFASDLVISDDQIRAGCDFNAKFVADRMKENGEMDFYVYCDKTDKKLTKKAVTTWQKANYATFKDFATNHSSICTVTFPKDANNWKTATCTCLQFDSDFMCEHIISITHQLNILEKPKENYDDEPLYVAKKGRPTKPPANPLQKD